MYVILTADIKQFSCVNETMFLSCPGNMGLSVLRTMFGDLQRACADNYMAICTGNDGNALLVPSGGKTCTNTPASAQTYCRFTQLYNYIGPLCNFFACKVPVTPSMAAYCPSVPSNGSYMLLVEYNCNPGVPSLTFSRHYMYVCRIKGARSHVVAIVK